MKEQFSVDKDEKIIHIRKSVMQFLTVLKLILEKVFRFSYLLHARNTSLPLINKHLCKSFDS